MLTIWDYIIIVGYLLGVVIIGLLFSGRQTSLREYFLAGGNMPWWAVAISTYATEMSAISFLGTASWIFRKDTRVVATTILIFITVPLAAKVWVPIWSRLRMLSIFEYLQYRYHPAVRNFASALFPIQTIFWIGNGLVASSMAFSATTGVRIELCLIGIVALGTVYTALGGARAVMWTDVVQFVVFMGAYLIILGLLLDYYGWDPMRIYAISSSIISEETNNPHTSLISTEFSLAVEATIWVLLVNQFMSILNYGTNQVAMQRLMATKTRRDMYKAVIAQGGITLLVVILTTTTAWAFVAFYHDNQAAQMGLEHSDQLVAHYTVNFVPFALVRGLMLAGLLAAMMSSFDSAVNSMGSVTVNDFYRPYFAPSRTTEHYVGVARLLSLGWGLAILLFAWWQLGHSDSVVGQRLGQLSATLAAPLPIFFTLGIFARRANTGGVLIGAICSVIFALMYNGFPGIIDAPLSGINWMWIGVLSTLVGIACGLLASLLFPKPEPQSLQGLTLFQKNGDRKLDDVSERERSDFG